MRRILTARWSLAALLVALAAAATFFDGAVARWAATLPEALRRIWMLISLLGTSGYMYGVGALVLGTAVVRLRRLPPDHPDRGRHAATIERCCYILAVLLVSGVAAQVLKHLIGRARPLRSDFDPFLFAPLSFKASWASFPSGHTATAFAVAVALAIVFGRFRAILFAAATIIATSRIVLASHYVSDVMCGAALGLVTALALANYRGWQAFLRSSVSGLAQVARRARTANEPRIPRSSGHSRTAHPQS